MPSSPPNTLADSGLASPRPGLSGPQLSRLQERLRQAKQGGTKAAPRQSIPRRNETGPAPLSHAQERLWFLDQLVTDRGLYNVYQAVRIMGPLDPAALER